MMRRKDEYKIGKDKDKNRSKLNQMGIHKLVLTGGPCGGKTTGQAHLATFFESLGWKVFRVPETATVLMSGGISFGELNEEQVRELCKFCSYLAQRVYSVNPTSKRKDKVQLNSGQSVGFRSFTGPHVHHCIVSL